MLQEILSHQRTIAIIAISTLLAGQLISIYLTNTLSTLGESLATIDDTIIKLQTENMYLKSQVAKESSLQTIQLKAFKLGFRQTAPQQIQWFP